MTEDFSHFRFCVAPMMEWTDRHCRMFHRHLSKKARLYSEMVTTKAVIHGDRERLLGFDAREMPVALQLGGSDARELADCAKIAEDFGYCEVNLNCGCPSDRVQSGAFGACLMKEPEKVAQCLSAMREAVKIPITVKCRIGVDDQIPEEALLSFMHHITQSGVRHVIIHARKAWLKGLSPKENRDIPPLDYDLVYQMKREFSHLCIIINGGITTIEEAKAHLLHVDGVMLGRAAYHDPSLLLGVDREIFGCQTPLKSRFEALSDFRDYALQINQEGVAMKAFCRHILGLMNGLAGARGFRRLLTEEAIRLDADVGLIDQALALMHHAEQKQAQLSALRMQNQA